MKKQSTFLYLLPSTICALGLMTCVVSAQLLGTLSDGLVLSYQFNGDCVDSSDFNNNGTPIGVMYRNDRYGASDSALYIPNGSDIFKFTYGGNNENVQSIVNIPISGNSNRSISYWCKFDNANSYVCLSWGLSYPGYYYHNNYIQSGSTESYTGVQNDSTWFTGSYADKLWASGINVDDIWRQVTFTYSENLGGASLYVDGKLLSNGVIGTGDPLLLNSDGILDTDSTPLKISGFNGGFIDDVNIWNRTLSSSEVSTLYNTQSVPEPSTYALLLLSGAASLFALRRRKN